MYKLVYICIGVYTCVFMCTCGYMCLVICYRDADLFVRSALGNRRPRPDLNLCLLWTQYAGDSKTDPWDDPKICTNLCSGDQTVIQFQNSVISCGVCLLVYFNFSTLS